MVSASYSPSPSISSGTSTASSLNESDGDPYTEQVNQEFQREEQRQMVNVRGDGNCWYAAVSHQLWRCPEYSSIVKDEVITHMKQFKQFYWDMLQDEQVTVTESNRQQLWTEYINKKEQPRVWAG
jgi:hypothetical protein